MHRVACIVLLVHSGWAQAQTPDPSNATSAPELTDRAARARSLRAAGQVTTGLALAGLIATFAVAETDDSELDRAYGRIIGASICTPLLAAGTTMWGIGDHRVRRSAVAWIPSVTWPPSGARATAPRIGVALVGVW